MLGEPFGYSIPGCLNPFDAAFQKFLSPGGRDAVRVGEPDRILTRPYRTSIYVPELAAGKRVMAFGDYSYYWIAERQGRSFKRLNELYATTGQVGFLASERVDGKLILSEAVKTLDVKAAG